MEGMYTVVVIFELRISLVSRHSLASEIPVTHTRKYVIDHEPY